MMGESTGFVSHPIVTKSQSNSATENNQSISVKTKKVSEYTTTNSFWGRKQPSEYSFGE